MAGILPFDVVIFCPVRIFSIYSCLSCPNALLHAGQEMSLMVLIVSASTFATTVADGNTCANQCDAVLDCTSVTV